MQHKKILVVWVNITFTSLKWLRVIQKQTFIFFFFFASYENDEGEQMFHLVAIIKLE